MGKCAGTTRNERDVACNSGREISDVAAYVADLDKIALDIVGRGTVGQVVGLDICAGNGELDGGCSKKLDEGLLVDLPVVVAELLQAVKEPVGCAVVGLIVVLVCFQS